jgi:predicted 2-oxoglutarate/Fe(II)-dependent dioxygenase YbiX
MSDEPPASGPPGPTAGEPAPLFHAPSPINPRFSFQSLAGHYVLMAFLPGPGPERDAALGLIVRNRALFDDGERVFFAVLPDEASYAQVANRPPLRWFGDFDGAIRRAYGAADAEGGVSPRWVLIDPALRIFAYASLDQGPAMLRRMASLGGVDDHAGVPLHAPVLIVPRVFEPELCQRLVALYQADGGSPSGVTKSRDGLTYTELNDNKRRRDAQIEDEALRAAIRARLARRLAPELRKAMQFEAAYVERYIVACYASADQGYFRPHRDNTTPGTAHRKFAVSINLNDDFDGGDLRFPEFGGRTYRPPVGGAVAFSCSLLHEATPMTRGVRYACLPFLYDEAGAKVRAANLHTFREVGADGELVVPAAAG